MKANARYGYLITDQELVVVEISITTIDTDDEWATLRYKAIPWETGLDAPSEDLGPLTVNMALWLLHLAAAWDGKIAVDKIDLDRKFAKLKKRLKASVRHSTRLEETTPELVSGQPAEANDHNMSFRSEGSDLRVRFSGATLDDTREDSSTPAKSKKKRTLDAEEGGEISRRRRMGYRPSGGRSTDNK